MILLPPPAMKEGVYHRVGSRPLTLSIAAFEEVLTNGGHHPLLARVHEGETLAGRWVVKPLYSVSAANRRPGLSLIAEVVGAELCACLGLLTPEIGFARFPGDDVELAALLSSASRLGELGEVFALNKGELAFCCRFLRNTALVEAELLPEPEQAPHLPQQAALILVLDAFLAHFDRRHNNPNLLHSGRDLIVIDHGDALAGLERSGETGEGLAQKTVLPRAMREHVLLGWVARHASLIDWNAIVGAFGGLKEEHWQALLDKLPAELGEPARNNGQEIRSRVARFLKRRQPVVPELVEALRQLVEVNP